MVMGEREIHNVDVKFWIYSFSLISGEIPFYTD